MIRAMTEADLPQVLTIERESFSDAWTEGMFLGTFKVPFCYNFVYELAGEVVGYILGTLLFDEAEVCNVATAISHRGKGIGKALMDAFESKVVALGGKKCFLEVRVGNTPARTLYEKRGYRQIAVRKKYYPDGEDALAMQKIFEE